MKKKKKRKLVDTKIVNATGDEAYCAERNGWPKSSHKSSYGMIRHLPNTEEPQNMIYPVGTEVFRHLLKNNRRFSEERFITDVRGNRPMTWTMVAAELTAKTTGVPKQKKLPTYETSDTFKQE